MALVLIGDARPESPGRAVRPPPKVEPLMLERTWFAYLRALVGVAALLVVAVPQPAGATGTAAATVVGTEGVNIRSCPRLECDVLAVAPLGRTVAVTGASRDGFTPVIYKRTSGFAYDLYLLKPGQPVPQLISGASGCKRIALIFNIGIGEAPATEILDTLKAEKVPATMFVMGWWAQAQGDLLRRMVDDGFPIGSHGFERLGLTQRSDADVVRDIQAAGNAIQKVTGEQPGPWFTPYAADTDERVADLIASRGYLPVGWRVPAADYGGDATAESVYGRVMPNIYDGAIVEMHMDGPASSTSTAVALPWIINELRAQGYTFVTISQMAGPCP